MPRALRLTTIPLTLGLAGALAPTVDADTDTTVGETHLRLTAVDASFSNDRMAFELELAASASRGPHEAEFALALPPAGVVTGEDFTFGRGRGGNTEVLRQLGALHAISARTVGAVSEQGEIVSSSRIREALKAGDCAAATHLLTRPFAIRGVVQHGDKVGRTIGFPTANLALGTYLRPRYGIYAVTATLPGGRVVHGAANMGVRPTFDPPKELLEPHFFDFSGDLYGQEIEVEFHHFLRPEAKFNSLDALTAQMEADCLKARKLLA